MIAPQGVGAETAALRREIERLTHERDQAVQATRAELAEFTDEVLAAGRDLVCLIERIRAPGGSVEEEITAWARACWRLRKERGEVELG